MEENLEGLGVGSQYDNFRDTTVQGLRGCRWRVNGLIATRAQHVRTFIGTFLQLLVLRSLLDEIEDLLRA